MNDRIPDHDDSSWAADFDAAERHRLDASLSVTVSERLRWLEEALRFAAKLGAPPKDDETE